MGPASRLKQHSACLHQQSVCIPFRSHLHPAIKAQVRQQLHAQHASQCHDQHKQDNALISRRQILTLGIASAPVLQLTSFCKQSPAAVVDEDIATKVYTACSASVVTVVHFKGGSKVSNGGGSGFVWDRYGHIVTNYHVMSGLQSSDVTWILLFNTNGSEPTILTPRLIAVDTVNDIAVLKVDSAEALQPAMLGSSADLKIGQAAFAMGAPYGLDGTLSAGVVSGLNRSIPSFGGARISGMIQTDAPLHGGSSGGPLFDSSARVIGVNTATFQWKLGTGKYSGPGSGANFALPVDKVREIVPNLIVFGNAAGKCN